MNKDKLTEALSYIDPAFIEEADIQTAKPKGRWKRPALIAACLCLVLAGTALASEIAGVSILGFVEYTDYLENGEEAQISDYNLAFSGIEKVPVESLSQDVLDLIAEAKAEADLDQPGWHRIQGIDSMAEMRRFLGWSLAYNSYLSLKSHAYTAHTDSDANDEPLITYPCMVEVWGHWENAFSVSATAYYSVGDSDTVAMLASVEATQYTDLYDSSAWAERYSYEGIADAFRARGYRDGVLTSEPYTTPGGIEAEIIRVEWASTCCDYDAYFILNGMVYFVNVSAFSDSEEDVHVEAESVMKQILDGFDAEVPAQP